jgi:aspartate carbamoyltransferase catalytic subunit
MKHVLSASQFEKSEVDDLFERADYFAQEDLSRWRTAGRYAGKQLCALFYQPSTRTRLSFESAANRFDMGRLSTENAGEFSSAAKGETLEDTIRVINGYAHMIVLRHPVEGSAAAAAEVSDVPIINAGDGGNEHPTQALTDVYTINQQLGRTDNLDIVFGGDLRFGRTVRSAVDLLSRLAAGNTFTFIAPDELQVSPDIEEKLSQRGVKFAKTDELEDGLHGADVVYWTRLQTENLKDPLQQARIKQLIKRGKFRLNERSIRAIPASGIILHPLPRVDEITPAVDKSLRAKYFKQAHNSVPVRQAVIDKIFTDAAAA